MSVFMSDGLAEIISIPEDDLTIEASSVITFRLNEIDGKKSLSVTVSGKTSILDVMGLVGKVVKIKLPQSTIEFRANQVSFKDKANTFKIKGSLLNTY